MSWVVAIPALPAAAFAVLLVVSRSVRMRLLWLPIAAIFGSLGLSIAAFARVWPGGTEEPVYHGALHFGQLGGSPLELTMALDPTAAIMLLVVTIVGTCVQVYSVGYMHRDEREGWYFAVLSLFTSAMLVLVLAADLLLAFMAWELMGLCSYLLIGFWFENEAPRKASQKAFLTTKVGDLGFVVALCIIFATVGEFGYEAVLGSLDAWTAPMLAAAGFGLLFAAMGKSAQLPLHVWLPDAMAGPTPASALIHAATMVAAGIYVLARMLPLLAATAWLMDLTLYIGIATALMGGVLACIQHDVKKVLAYSTISQLGLMVVALGAGSSEVALFHLTTHAYFKSLLFLGAGVIIHAAHTQDRRQMGGLGPKMPVTAATFTVGTLALAGLFPFSGFFSKDEIVAVLMREGHYTVLALTWVASLLTAYYVARLLFRVFAGPAQSEAHEGHTTMLTPMVVLAVITTVGGGGTVAFVDFLGGEGHWPKLIVAIPSLAVAGLGLATGWWVHGRKGAVVNTRIYKQRLTYVYGVLEQRVYFDWVYDNWLIRPFFALTRALARFDRSVLDTIINGAAWLWVGASRMGWRFDGAIVDGAVNAVARLDVRVSAVLELFDQHVVDGAVNTLGEGVRKASSIRRIHTGNAQTYLTVFVVAAVLLVLVLVR